MNLLIISQLAKQADVCIPPPVDYWTDYSSYNGPTFDPYDMNIAV